MVRPAPGRWSSTCDDPHRPSWALIDIDAGETTSSEDVLVLARLDRTALDHVGVEGAPKVTGRRGIQIWVPIARGPTFTRCWVETISRAIGRTTPELVSWKWRVEGTGGTRPPGRHPGRDQRDARGALQRPTAGRGTGLRAARVAELDDPALRPDRWDLRSVIDRLADVGDPFRPLLSTAQTLPPL